MAKTRRYRVTLHPAKREGGFIVTKYEMFGTYPEKEFEAAGLQKVIETVAAFAKDHGKPCSASVRCLAGRKPPGFDKATSGLYFFLDEAVEAG